MRRRICFRVSLVRDASSSAKTSTPRRPRWRRTSAASENRSSGTIHHRMLGLRVHSSHNAVPNTLRCVCLPHERHVRDSCVANGNCLNKSYTPSPMACCALINTQKDTRNGTCRCLSMIHCAKLYATSGDATLSLHRLCASTYCIIIARLSISAVYNEQIDDILF